MSTTRLLILGLGCSAVLAVSATAQRRSNPASVRGHSPAWVMAGATVPVRLLGSDLNAKEIRFAEPGFSAKVIKSGPNQAKVDSEKKLGNTQVEVEVNVPADAKPGLHAFELVRETGPALTGKLLVDVPAPEVQEKEPNGSLRQPQVLPEGNVTILGKLDGDGADVFQFPVKNGEKWRVEVFVRRLPDGGKFEPVLRLRDPLLAPVRAAVDQGWDCSIEYTAKVDGPHLVEIFDGDNRSGGDFTYRLHLRKIP